MADDNRAERTEEVVAQIMRSTRDEKIRLDAVNAEQAKQIAALEARDRETMHRHAEEIAKLADDRDHYLKRATQLESDLRSMIAILNDALTNGPAK